MQRGHRVDPVITLERVALDFRCLVGLRIDGDALSRKPGRPIEPAAEKDGAVGIEVVHAVAPHPPAAVGEGDRGQKLVAAHVIEPAAAVGGEFLAADRRQLECVAAEAHVNAAGAGERRIMPALPVDRGIRRDRAFVVIDDEPGVVDVDLFGLLGVCRQHRRIGAVAEILPNETPVGGVPHAHPLGRGIVFHHPEAAGGIHRDAGGQEHAGGVIPAEPRPAAILADAALLFPVR